MDPNTTNSVTILLLLIIALIFTFIEFLELNKLWLIWESSQKIIEINFFNNCVKYQILTKGIFTVFSLFISFSAVFLTFFIYISLDYFIDKVLGTFVYYNYFIFGPYLLAFSILGLLNWENFLYVCKDTRFLDRKNRFYSFFEKNKDINFYNKDFYKQSKSLCNFNNLVKNNCTNLLQKEKLNMHKINNNNHKAKEGNFKHEKYMDFFPHVLLNPNSENNKQKEKDFKNYLYMEPEEIKTNKNNNFPYKYNNSSNTNSINSENIGKNLIYDFLKQNNNYFLSDDRELNGIDEFENNNLILVNNKQTSDREIPISNKGLRNNSYLDLNTFEPEYLSNEKYMFNPFFHKKIISVPNAFNLTLGLLVSSILCFIMGIYESHEYFIDSILRRNSGNPLIAFLFWKTISFCRERERDRIRPNSNRINTNNDYALLDQEQRNLLIADNEIVNLIESNNNQDVILYNGNNFYTNDDNICLDHNENCSRFENLNKQAESEILFENNLFPLEANENNFLLSSHYRINNLRKLDEQRRNKVKENIVRFNSNQNLLLNDNIIPFNDANSNIHDSSENINLNNSNSTIDNKNITFCKYYSLIKFNKKREKLISKYHSNKTVKAFIEDFKNFRNLNDNISIFNGEFDYIRSNKNKFEQFYDFHSEYEEIIRPRSLSERTFDNLRNVL
jgi:hypothetical protein